MFRLRLLAFLLALGALAGFGSGVRHLSGGGGWGDHCGSTSTPAP